MARVKDDWPPQHIALGQKEQTNRRQALFFLEPACSFYQSGGVLGDCPRICLRNLYKKRLKQSLESLVRPRLKHQKFANSSPLCFTRKTGEQNISNILFKRKRDRPQHWWRKDISPSSHACQPTECAVLLGMPRLRSSSTFAECLDVRLGWRKIRKRSKFQCFMCLEKWNKRGVMCLRWFS